VRIVITTYVLMSIIPGIRPERSISLFKTVQIVLVVLSVGYSTLNGRTEAAKQDDCWHRNTVDATIVLRYHR
jgi:hypothetical protein